MKRSLVLALVLSALAVPAAALEIRSDLPLWGAGESREPVWPQHFFEGDSFGCRYNIMTGDWRYRDADDQPDGGDWLRISNYGLMHCAARFGEAYRREALRGGKLELGFIVGLGDKRGPQGVERLYALQIGLHSARYVLLAAPAATPPGDQPIERFRVLDADCPRANLRKGPTIDIFRTSYCVVNDRRTMISVARAAAAKPSETWLERVGGFEPTED